MFGLLLDIPMALLVRGGIVILELLHQLLFMLKVSVQICPKLEH
jgi:hypothetical protein